MKKTILFLSALLWVSGATMAQQAQVERRSKIPFAYKDFKDGNIELAFGKDKIYKANIFLKDASLLYKNDTTVMKANLFGVISVDFGDALYRKTGDRMGKVIEQKGEVFLTVVTTIDTDRMREDARSGRNSTFLDLPEFNLFIDTNADYWAEGEGSSWPLKDEYFFVVKGEAIPAAEKIVKKSIRADKRNDFKELMKNRKWSWKDANSLKVLVDYF
ncbi:MAG: hypothetical protein DBY24_00770 [Prevotellaceae bacterium]|jgi:hypothetical protein|nr:MAG: hypothetical protein DBY24_00770 [Prevotellaceae bacterium]